MKQYDTIEKMINGLYQQHIADDKTESLQLKPGLTTRPLRLNAYNAHPGIPNDADVGGTYWRYDNSIDLTDFRKHFLESAREALVHELSHAIDYDNPKDSRIDPNKRENWSPMTSQEKKELSLPYKERPTEVRARARALAYRLNRYYNQRPSVQQHLSKPEYMRLILNNYFNESPEVASQKEDLAVEHADDLDGTWYIHRLFPHGSEEIKQPWTKDFIKYLNRFLFETKQAERSGIKDLPSDSRVKYTYLDQRY